MILSSFLLMLPLPVPLTDFLPAYSILFLASWNDGKGWILDIWQDILWPTVTAIYFIFIVILGLSWN